MRLCAKCDGTGYDGNCDVCGGSGFVSETPSLNGFSRVVVVETDADNPKRLKKTSIQGSLYDVPSLKVQFSGKERLVTANAAGKAKKPRITIPPHGKKRKNNTNTVSLRSAGPKTIVPSSNAKPKKFPLRDVEGFATKARKQAPHNAPKKDNGRSSYQVQGKAGPTAFEAAFERASLIREHDGSREWSSFRDVSSGQYGSYPSFDPADDYDE